ncbi:MAG TPA: LLM class flavin-dependent oxidoreductase [Streptosporangiaceae bacterium]|nr:LLM class flavin-dependent oxidoreductase [Streptosporangiaceae bacterium]
MQIGLALPTMVPATAGRDVMGWAIEGERAGFSSLATLDRLVYGNYESLTTLAAAAAVTERVTLMTAILIAPVRASTALLAKQAATVDRLSGGRLVLGMAVGARPDDFRAGGAEYNGRGTRFDAQLAEMRRIWAGERRGFAGAIGPSPTRAAGPELILGGNSDKAIARAASSADGWISGSAGPAVFAAGAGMMRAAWREAGRPGKPRLLSLAYFALGGEAQRLAREHLLDYYGFAPPYAQSVLSQAAIGEDGVTRAIAAFQDAGCDELVFVPCSADIGQMKLLSALLANTGIAAAGSPGNPG